MDGREWIQCEKCNKWNHTDCEVENGKDKDMREIVKEFSRKQTLEDEANPVEDDDDPPYYCVKCRVIVAKT